MKYFFYFTLLFISTQVAGQVQHANLELNKNAQGRRVKAFGSSNITWGKVDTQEPNDYVLNLFQNSAIQNGKLGFNLANNPTDDISIGFRDEIAGIWYRIQFTGGEAIIKAPNQELSLGVYAASNTYAIIYCDNAIEFYADEELSLIVDNLNPNNTLTASLQLLEADFTVGYLQVEEYQGACNSTSLQVFAELNLSPKPGYVNISNHILGFTYKEKYAISTGKNDIAFVKIFDKNRVRIDPNVELGYDFENHYGQNFHALDLAPFNLTEGQVYFMEISGTNKNSTYYLSFKHTN